MHEGMPYDPIRGQSQGHGVCTVPKIALFQLYLLRHSQWQLANDQYFILAGHRLIAYDISKHIVMQIIGSYRYAICTMY